MPNHFLTIGLCSRNHTREDVDLSALNGVNLCELAYPMPGELLSIVSPNNYRYRNKQTGVISVNGEIPHSEHNQWEMVPLTSEEITELRTKYGAVNWYEWACEHWGTKWETYDTKVHEMGGDGSPILIEFQTAWSPPFPETMQKIDKYIKEIYDIQNIKWIGHDPSNGSIDDIQTCR